MSIFIRFKDVNVFKKAISSNVFLLAEVMVVVFELLFREEEIPLLEVAASDFISH